MVDRGTVRIQIACVSGCLCSMSLPASVDVLNSTDPVKKKIAYSPQKSPALKPYIDIVH